jgi:RNA polymerase sigma-70 factor, ECF subfamily
MAESEGELAVAARDGNRQALDQLIQRLYRPVCALAFRLLGRREDPREIAQETFSRVARHIAEYEPGKSFAAWVFAIAANLCRTRAQRARTTWTLEDADTGPFEIDLPPDRRALHLENRDRVQAALDDLPYDLKVVVVLHFQQDLPLAEVADALAISRNAVGIRLCRALKLLRERLKE